MTYLILFNIQYDALCQFNILKIENNHYYMSKIKSKL